MRQVRAPPLRKERGTFSTKVSRLAELIVFCKAAEGETVAMTAAVPGTDEGAGEEEVAGGDAGDGVARPVVAVGTATAEATGVPVEVPAP